MRLALRASLLAAAVTVALCASASPASAFVCQGEATDVPRFCTYVGFFNKSTATFDSTDTRTVSGAWLGNCPPFRLGPNRQPNSEGYFVDCAMGAANALGGTAAGGVTYTAQTGGTVALDFKFTPGDPPNSATLTCDSAGATIPFDCPYFQWNANDSAQPPPPDGFPATSQRIYVHIYPASHRSEAPTVAIAHPASISARRLRRRGLPLRVRSSHGGRVVAELRRGRGRRAHGRAAKRIPVPDERHRLRLRLNRAGRRALRPGRYRLVLRVRSKFGKSSTVSRRLRVR